MADVQKRPENVGHILVKVSHMYQLLSFSINFIHIFVQFYLSIMGPQLFYLANLFFRCKKICSY